MKHEFKTIKTENETRYILETASAGATGASSVASVPVALGQIRKRIQELQNQLPQKPRQGPLRPQTGAGAHKNKKSADKRGEQKHKGKPFDESTVMELEKPTGSMFLKFITKQLPEDEKQVYGYAGFATDPRELRAATAKIKPFTVDNFDDVENNIEKILSDRDFIGVEKIIVVTKNLPDQYLDDLTALTDISDRVEIYQGDDDEGEKDPSGTMMRKNPETGSWEKVQKGAPKAQVAGSSHNITAQPKTFKYTLKNKDLMPQLRSMGFKFDGEQITLNKQQRDMLLSKLGDKFNTVFGASEKFVEDHEIRMASNELMSIIEDAMRLLKLVRQYSEMEGLEAWQQSKLTKAADYLNSVLNSLQGEQAFNTEDHNDFGAGWGQGSYETYAGTRHGRGVAEEHNDTFDLKSHQYKTTMKHADRPTVQQRMAAHDIKPGIAGYRDRIDLLKDLERTGKLKQQGAAEAAKWRDDDREGKTWRSPDWDDGDLSPSKIKIDRSGNDVDDSGDELTSRPGMWRGKADMAKRMTKKGVPTKSELAFQNNLKMRMRMKKKEGGLTGPQGNLPEQDTAEAFTSDRPDWRRFKSQELGQELGGEENKPYLVDRHYFTVPFASKDAAKQLGMRFDPNKKQWYLDQYNTSGNTFQRKMDQATQMFGKPNGVKEDPYMEELEAKLAEKIPPNAPVDVYIKDFEKSNAPQFRGKTKEKRKQMALAAYYAKKNPSKKK